MLTMFSQLPGDSMRNNRQFKLIGRSLCVAILAFASFEAPPSASQSSAPTPREQLQQYVTQLQANPADDGECRALAGITSP